MKVLILVAVLVACAQASKIPEIVEKFIPSFATGFVIKGENAVPHSAPYIVSLGTNPARHSHICGGTIIDRQWVVTAAHCVSTPAGMSVVAGLHVRSDMTNTQSRVVDFGKVHADFGGGVGPYDIALLHVSEPFVFNENIKPAVLPTRRETHEGKTHLYGWGQPTWYTISGAQILQTVETRVLPYADCLADVGPDSPLAESNICTDSMQKGISACNGDSGGPLVKEYDNAPTELVGVVSWGFIPCGIGSRPSIYTRVSAYIDWITTIQDAYYTLY